METLQGGAATRNMVGDLAWLRVGAPAQPANLVIHGNNSQPLGTIAEFAGRLEKTASEAAWWSVLDASWGLHVAPRVAQLLQRARRSGERARRLAHAGDLLAAVDAHRSSAWASTRARSLTMPRRDLLATCGRRHRAVRCGCGTASVPVGCGLTSLCESCGRRRWRRESKRVRESLTVHVAAARADWRQRRRGRVPDVYLLTLTARHTGDLLADRARMARAWDALRDVGRAWWSAYVATWEATPGVDGEGHCHLHVAAVSAWVPYDELRAAWSRALGEPARVHVSPPRGRRASRNAASYVAKYVSKGVQLSEWTPEKAAELLASARGRRAVMTSRRFWQLRPARCRCCNRQHELVGMPEGLAALAPGAVLRAHVAARDGAAGAAYRLLTGRPPAS